jgi:hypothetical protein
MIFSIEQTFSDEQVVTATAPSTNVIDLGEITTVANAPVAHERNLGNGRPVPVWISLGANADDPADTLQVELETDDDENFGSATTLAEATITGGTDGQRIEIYTMPNASFDRYIRLKYTVTGDTPSYIVTAGIVLAADQRGV